MATELTETETVALAITPEQLHDLLISINAKLDELIAFRDEMVAGLEQFQHSPVLKMFGGIFNRG